MRDEKMELIRDFHAEMMTIADIGTAERAANKLTMMLVNYEVRKACVELITRETESEMMLKNFLVTKKIEGRSDNTIKRYAYEIGRLADFVQRPTRQMNVYDFRRYLAKMSMDGKRMSTVASTQSVIKSYFGWLHKEGYIERDPSAQLGQVREEISIKQPFSMTDIDKIRSVATSLRDRALVEFLRSTGCRISEAVGLNRDSIDQAKMECVVHGKGNKYRTVYLDDVAMMHLRRYLKNRDDDSMALFAGRQTNRITQHGVREMLNKLGREAGVEHVHPHRFRRTLATNLAKRGMPVQEIARILGHANLDTTMIYVTMDDVGTKAAYAKYTA